MTVENLEDARKRRDMTYTPEELLDAVKEHIQEGVIKPKHMIVTLVHSPEGSDTEYPHYYCTPMGYATHVGLLEVSKHITMKDWLINDE